MAPSPIAAVLGRQVRMSWNQRGRLAAATGAGRPQPPISFGLRLTGHLEPDLVRRALVEVARRHSALRTYFPDSLPPGTARCLDADSATCPLEVVDLRGRLEDRRDMRADADRRLQEPFAPDRFPLHRAQLVRDGDGCTLLIAVDHAVFDGASVQVFLDDFADAYLALATGQPIDGTGSDFAEFSRHEHDWLGGAEAAAAFAHWTDVWAGFGPYPPAYLPVRADPAGGGGEWATTVSPRDVLATQRSLPYGYVSLPVLAAAAVLTAVRDLTGQPDLGLLHPSDRRFFDGADRMIGYLNNRVLLRVGAPAGSGFLEIVDRTRTAMLESLEHHMMPFEVLRQRLAPHVPDRHPPHPYIHLNVQSAPTAPSLPGVRASFFWPPSAAAFGNLPWIRIDLESGPDEISFTAGYSTSQFAAATVADLMGRAVAYLTGVEPT